MVTGCRRIRGTSWRRRGCDRNPLSVLTDRQIRQRPAAHPLSCHLDEARRGHAGRGLAGRPQRDGPPHTPIRPIVAPKPGFVPVRETRLRSLNRASGTSLGVDQSWGNLGPIAAPCLCRPKEKRPEHAHPATPRYVPHRRPEGVEPGDGFTSLPERQRVPAGGGRQSIGAPKGWNPKGVSPRRRSRRCACD